MRQGVAVERIERLAEAGALAEFFEALFCGDQGHGGDAGLTAYGDRELLRPLHGGADLEEGRDLHGGREIPGGRARVLHQQPEPCRQGERYRDDERRQQRTERPAQQTAECGDQRLQMARRPGGR